MLHNGLASRYAFNWADRGLINSPCLFASSFWRLRLFFIACLSPLSGM